MERRRWTNMKLIEAEIIEVGKAGKTRQEMADYFGVSKNKSKIGLHDTTIEPLFCPARTIWGGSR